MPIFNGQYPPDFTSGLMNLNSVTRMLFCIAQNDSSFRELDIYSLLGVSNILEAAGHEIEQAHDELFDKYEALGKRHRDLRAGLSAYIESHGLSSDSAIARILADDDQEVDR